METPMTQETTGRTSYAMEPDALLYLEWRDGYEDNGELTWAEFHAANLGDEYVLEAVSALTIGGSVTLGGGAAPICTITLREPRIVPTAKAAGACSYLFGIVISSKWEQAPAAYYECPKAGQWAVEVEWTLGEAPRRWFASEVNWSRAPRPGDRCKAMPADQFVLPVCSIEGGE